jgi:hypothetical protein
MTSEILNRQLRNYSKKVCSTQGRSNRRHRTIIGAEHKEIRKVDGSGSVPEPLAQKLKIELIKIAPLGTKGIDNYVGCCAEVRASNKIILSRNSAQIEKIRFTDAIRPRTGQRIKRCKNCNKVFG